MSQPSRAALELANAIYEHIEAGRPTSTPITDIARLIDEKVGPLREAARQITVPESMDDYEMYVIVARAVLDALEPWRSRGEAKP